MVSSRVELVSSLIQQSVYCNFIDALTETSFMTPDSVQFTFLSVPSHHLPVGGTPALQLTLQGRVIPLDRRRKYPQHPS